MHLDVTTILKLTIYTLAILILLQVAVFVLRKYKSKNSTAKKSGGSDYLLSYKSKPMFSENERSMYLEIKAVTDELNLCLFSKIRLCELLEPERNAPDYKNALWRLQTRHVDFVICDKDLNARVIIEIDDDGHNRTDRQARNLFVDASLKTSGYKVFHLNSINHDNLKNALSNL